MVSVLSKKVFSVYGRTETIGGARGEEAVVKTQAVLSTVAIHKRLACGKMKVMVIPATSTAGDNINWQMKQWLASW